MSAIQFLIIGAQKGGTTSLFEYMRRHPQIHMPANKEISFFDLNYSRGEEWYLASVLRDARPGAVCGEASVGYMCGTPYGEFRNDRNWDAHLSARYEDQLENIIPGRIGRLLPEIRLICVLRDPVARAYSHYSMACLGKAETRSFDQAVEDLLAQDAMEHARAMPLSDNGYIANGEYGRVLAGYLRTFAREQLKVVFSDELSNSPADTLAQVFEFVGVDAGYEPENLDTRYRAAALEPRVQGLDLYAWQRRLAAASPARSAWRRLPGGVRERVGRTYSVASFRTEMWNARRGVQEQEMSSSTRHRLMDHFRGDAELLRSLMGEEIPWLLEWGGS